MSYLTTVAVRMLLPLVLALAFATPLYAQADDWSGPWHGTLVTPGGSLRLELDVTADESGGYQATMESIDQAPGQAIPTADFTIGPDGMSFAIPAIGAGFEGEWAADANQFSGTFSQGVALPMSWERGRFETVEVPGLDGFWEGVLTRNDNSLRLHLRITTLDGATVASLDSPDQMAEGLAVTGLSRDGDTVRFQVPAATVTYEARLEGDRLTGAWTRPGFDPVEVRFDRTRDSAERIERPRPQLPTGPLPYATEEVSIDNPHADGVSLAGTLSLPAGDGPFPAAILISGSGPQDRDETVFGHQPFAVLADHLTRQGIAVLRYDDRGVAASTGSFAGATSADFATDANAVHAYLAARPEIDAEAVGFVGHSEGGMIAPIAARSNAHVAYMVLLAPPGTDTIQLVLAQIRLAAYAQGATDADIAGALDVQERLMRIVAASATGEDAEAQARELLTDEVMIASGTPVSQREAILARLNDPWFRYFTRYEPATAFEGLSMPVLALFGELDHQVPPEGNLPALEAALADNPDATVRELAGLNHMFQTAETGRMGEYNEIEETFDPEAMQMIADWINTRFAD